MRLLRGAWKVLVGVKDALVLIFMLLFFGLLYAALTATPNRAVGEGALLLDLDGSIVEQPAEVDPFAALSGPVAREYRLRDVVRALDKAATDDRVKAVALDLDGFAGAGQVALQSVGDALARVRAAKKPVIAYATGYTDDGYQLAAHASEIWLNPMGLVAFTGPGGSQLYFKGLLDRLGVNAHVYKVGAFKSAVEPFTRTDQSPEAEQANQALAGALWEAWQRDVMAARPKARVQQVAANPVEALVAPQGDMARAALAAGLVDRIGTRAEFAARVAEIAGEDKAKPAHVFKRINFDDWVAANPIPRGGTIGVATVAGVITDGEAGPGTAGGDTIAAQIRKGLAENNLKALVVRVDSPGGSALASEQIRVAILEAKRKGLPVIVSMGNLAASGGYWVATAGDHVFAEPGTITGSIGVFGIVPSFEETLAKIGVTTDGVQTTPLSGQPDLLGGMNPAVDQLFQAGVEGTYARFVALVSEARKLPPARVNEIAQGRVWDGGTARQLGLVDQFGSLDAAVAEAARRAKIDPDDARVVYLEEGPSFFETMLQGLMRDDEEAERGGATDVLTQLARRNQALLAAAVADARMLAEGPAIQARCLECGAVAPRAGLARVEKSLLDWLVARIAG